MSATIVPISIIGIGTIKNMIVDLFWGKCEYARSDRFGFIAILGRLTNRADEIIWRINWERIKGINEAGRFSVSTGAHEFNNARKVEGGGAGEVMEGRQKLSKKG